MITPMVKRMLYGLAAILVVVFGGGIGYYLIGDGKWSFGDCIYMTVITITTVGYDEVLTDMKNTEFARSFTIILLVFGTGTIVFFASTVTAFIIEGDLRSVLTANKLEKRRKRMKDHIVVCGAGSTGRNVISELIAIGQPIIAVDTRADALKEFADKHPDAAYAYVVGDATSDEALAQCNLAEARGFVAALSSDKDNLYLAFSVRQLNPNLRIIARATEIAHVDKLKRSGADAVISPNFIGGMRMVSELMRPAAVRFLDDMLRDRNRVAHRIEEIKLGDRTSALGATLRDAGIREKYGMTVLAVSKEDGAWTYNPDAGEPLHAGLTLVVLGSADQVAALRDAVS
jgi:voltage-gated potassium channel